MTHRRLSHRLVGTAAVTLSLLGSGCAPHPLDDQALDGLSLVSVGEPAPDGPASWVEVDDAGRHQRFGRDWIRLGGRMQLVTYAVEDGVAWYDGDIRLGPVDELEARRDDPQSKSSTRLDSDARWPNGVMPVGVSFSGVDPNDRDRDTINDAIARWNAHSDVTGVRVVARGNHRDYVRIRVTDGDGCFSDSIGRDGGRQIIELGLRCVTTGTVMHELGHAIGLYHEQTRFDRSEHVEVHQSRIDLMHRHNFWTLGDRADRGGYDFHSLMHYDSYAFAQTDGRCVVNRDCDGLNACIDGRCAEPTITSRAWQISWAGSSAWQEINRSGADIDNLLLADFDGDGRTDVMRTDGRYWWISLGATSPWQRWNRSSIRAPELRVGDFDGDGRADVFRTYGGRWRVSLGGSTGWQDWNGSNLPLSRLRFGDFDGDGRTDVFYANGQRWRYSRGGRSGWDDLARSTTRESDLRFGDFDGDGRTDVLFANGDVFKVSLGGREAWQVYAHSSLPASRLRVGDFDGDGGDDLLYSNGDSWRWLPGARGGWRVRNTSSHDVSDLRLGDFDGDGRVDVMLPEGQGLVRASLEPGARGPAAEVRGLTIGDILGVRAFYGRARPRVYHEIRSGVRSDMCLDLRFSSARAGTNVQLWRCNGSDAQKWRMTEDGELRPAIDDSYCLDVAASDTGLGTNVQLWPCNGTDAQRFGAISDFGSHVALSTDAGGQGADALLRRERTIELRSTLTRNRCVDVAASGTTNGTNVQLWSCNGTDAQVWMTRERL